MPPAKKKPQKAVRKSTSANLKRSGPRKMSAAHKKALSEGRALSATVDRYLTAISTPRKRGRKVSRSALERRLAVAQEQTKSTVGVARLLAAQDVRDLRARLTDGSANDGDIKSLQAEFVKVAKKFGENRGISYGAWRDAGVPADVLRRAGVARTRG
jgi:hypothetical protein